MAPIPRDLDFADTAPWLLDFEGTVSATPGEVFDVFADNEGWARWFDGCKACRSTSAPPQGVGSTREISVRGLKVSERFIAWEPGELWAFTAVGINAPFARSLVERVRFTDVGGGRTRIDYRMAVEPRRWATPLRAIIARQATPAFAKSFANLDRLLGERRRSPSGQ